MQDVTIPDNEQPDILGEMLDAALATRPGPVRTSPYCEARQEAVDDLELAAEWQVSADALLADENQGLRMLARQRANVDTHTAWLESQLADARRKKHAAEARAVDAERQLAEALKDSAYEHEALMAAQARIAELEAAVRIAEPAPIERAGPDLATAHAITAHDPTFWFRRCTLLERERAELCAQNARLEARLKAAGGDKPAAAAPAEPPAPDKVTRHLLDLKVSEMAPLEALTKLMELKRMALEAAPDDDEPTLASLGDRKAQQGRTVDVPPLKRKPVNDLPDVA